MKEFELTRDMLTLTGQFYPTGHIVAMFPSLDAARAAVRQLADAGIHEDGISLLTPEIILRDIVRTVGNEGMPLPSAGTEADTVRQFADLASKGHHGLLIHSPGDDDASERLMQVLRGNGVSYAQKYRRLIIEDLA